MVLSYVNFTYIYMHKSFCMYISVPFGFSQTPKHFAYTFSVRLLQQNSATLSTCTVRGNKSAAARRVGV